MGITWNEEQARLLVGYLAEGLTASQIAPLLGVSRNAVIGKAHRMKMVFKNKKIAAMAPKKAKPRKPSTAHAKSTGPKIVLPVPPPPLLPPEGGVSLIDLETNHCRAVIGQGDDGLARFCGAPKEGLVMTRGGFPVQSAYCPDHGNRYYNRSIR